MSDLSKNVESVFEIGDENNLNFGHIPFLIMLDQRLTVEAKAIYSYFCSHSEDGFYTFPSVSEIIKDLKISETRYYKHFALLKKYGYVSVRENKIGGKFATNTYILHTHPKYHSDRK